MLKNIIKHVKNNRVNNINTNKKDIISIYDESNSFMNDNIGEVETFYNKMNRIYSSEDYLTIRPEDQIQLEARRRTLGIQFENRAKFLLDTRLDIMSDILRFSDICKYSYGISYKQFENIPELFRIDTYVNIINNPNTATDYAMAMNSIYYNLLLFGLGRDKVDKIKDINNFMMLSMNEFANILNILNNEAAIYYQAGYPDLRFSQADMYAPGCCPIQGVDITETVDLKEGNIIASGIVEMDIPNNRPQHIELTGQERANALIEMGQSHLIDTDVKVGRF